MSERNTDATPPPENHPSTTAHGGFALEPELWQTLKTELSGFFATQDDVLLGQIEQKIVFQKVGAGEVLFLQGDTGEDLFFVLSGRLRAVLDWGKKTEKVLGEIGRGKTVGEMALLSGQARSATVVAVRDSLLAKLSQEDFAAITEAAPKWALALARTVIERLMSNVRARQPVLRPVICTVLPVTAGMGVRDFLETFLPYRQKYGGPIEILAVEDLPESIRAQPSREQRESLMAWLAAREARAEAIFLIGHEKLDLWTNCCVRSCDEILLLAEAAHEPGLSPLEKELFDGEHEAPTATQTLILVHDPSVRSPTGTPRWLEPRSVGRHFHVRHGHAKDLGRLARFLSGRAVGIVMAGGGAKAFSHFGVINALEEFGIEPDCIGGTSMGATAAGWRASGLTGAEYVTAGRDVYLSKPTSRINLLPLLSVISGHKVKMLAERAVDACAGTQIDITDTWIPFYCIATDLSSMEEAVLRSGPLSRALLASFSIPGALPPVIFQNHLMVDGGTMNNFPVDVMESLGMGKIIGLAMEPAPEGAVAMDDLPTNFALFLDRFRKPAQRLFPLPLLPEIILNSSLAAAQSRSRRARERCDLLLQPNTAGVRLLDWTKFDDVVEIGYRYAKEVLSRMSEEELDQYR
jgi:NTE family protein